MPVGHGPQYSPPATKPALRPPFPTPAVALSQSELLTDPHRTTPGRDDRSVMQTWARGSGRGAWGGSRTTRFEQAVQQVTTMSTDLSGVVPEAVFRHVAVVMAVSSKPMSLSF